MSNALLNSAVITREALRVLKTQITFAGSVNRQYDDKFANKGAKIGDICAIRKPPKFKVTNGAAINIQDVEDESVNLQLDTQNHVAFQFSSKELTLNIDDFSERYIKPAVAPLVAQLDADGLAQYINIFNSVGVPGVTPATFKLATDAKAYLNRSGAPYDDNRCMVINSTAESSMVDALKSLFQSSNQIKLQYEKGVMGITGGFTWKNDDHLSNHTVGAYAGTPLVDGAAQTGATLLSKDWTANTSSLAKGDIFTIAGVYSVNPQTKASTGVLQQFVVTAAITATAGGAKDIAIAPSIVITGAGQTVSGSPADVAAITMVGAASTASPQNMAFHKDAFALGMADLELPSGVDFAYRANDPESGLACRVVRQYDINTDKFPCRLDILYGWTTLYKEFACRVQG